MLTKKPSLMINPPNKKDIAPIQKQILTTKIKNNPHEDNQSI